MTNSLLKMISWLLFLKTDNTFSHIDITFKRGDCDKTYMRISEMVNRENIIEIEQNILNLINLYVPVREHVYIVLDQENPRKYQLEKMMPKLSSRIHQVIYAGV